jgi:hypothetical protein
MDHPLTASSASYSFQRTPTREGTEIALLEKRQHGPGPAAYRHHFDWTKASSCPSSSGAPRYSFGTSVRQTTIDRAEAVPKTRFVTAEHAAHDNLGVWSPGPIYFPVSTLGGGGGSAPGKKGGSSGAAGGGGSSGGLYNNKSGRWGVASRASSPAVPVPSSRGVRSEAEEPKAGDVLRT